MRKKTLFIVNPISGIGRQKRIEQLLEHNLDKDIFDYTDSYTEYIHHGSEQARTAAEQHYNSVGAEGDNDSSNDDCVVAVGGDGSVSDVLQGRKGTDLHLGIIPAGSGNGLANSLHIPLQPWLAIRALNHLYEQTIDSIVINDQYICVNAAGVGFDAYISRMMQSAKTRGLPAYTNMVLHAYNSYQSSTYTITINGHTFSRNAWLIAIQNSSRIGFNMPVSNKARIDDGILDISIIDKVPLDHVAITMPLAIGGHLELSQHVEMFRSPEVLIEGNENKWVDIDGEGINLGRTVHCVNNPHSIKVYTRDLKRPLIIRTPTQL